MTSMACLAFSMVLADTFSSLLGSTERTKILLALTTCILLPLCWMKNLASLAPFSLLGVIGMAFTGFAMLVKYLDGSYSGPAVSGTLLETVAENLRPSFGSDGWESVLNPKSLILVCMLSTAFMAHYNAPKFYLELQNNTLQRYNTVVATSFGISILLMGSITAIGFLTFGASCSGLVLNNYSSKDTWMATSRIAVAIALIFSYPLAFQGCRDGILDLLKVSEENKTKNSFLNLTTICLLGTITLFAATLTDVSFVLAFGGGTLCYVTFQTFLLLRQSCTLYVLFFISHTPYHPLNLYHSTATLGNALIYVFPAIMYSSVVKKQNLQGEGFGVLIANLSAVLGLVMGTIGAKMALEK
jgi:amino acid permease